MKTFEAIEEQGLYGYRSTVTLADNAVVEVVREYVGEWSVFVSTGDDLDMPIDRKSFDIAMGRGNRLVKALAVKGGK